MVRNSLALYDSKCWNAHSQSLSNIARDPAGVCGFQTYSSASLSKLAWPHGLFLLWLQNVISSPSIHWQKKCCLCHLTYIRLPRAPPLTQTLMCFSSRLLDHSSVTCPWLTTQLVRGRKCVSQGFCCWGRYHDQKQLEEVKGLFHLPACIPSPRKVRVETQGSAQAMEECCLQTCSPWLAQPGSLRRLRITWPEVVPPQWSLPPNQSFVKKMPHRLTCRSLLLNYSSLFSDSSSLCQVDHKLSRIMAMISLEPWSLQRLGTSQSGMSLQRTKQILC